MGAWRGQRLIVHSALPRVRLDAGFPNDFDVVVSFHNLGLGVSGFAGGGGMVGRGFSDGSTRLHGLLAISVLRSSSFLHASSVSSQSRAPLISFKAPFLRRARLSLGDEYGKHRDYGPHGATPPLYIIV